MPVGGEPMIRRIVRWLVSQGVTNLVLNLHHRPGERDRRPRRRQRPRRARPLFVGAAAVLGSAGGPARAADSRRRRRSSSSTATPDRCRSRRPGREARSSPAALVTHGGRPRPRAILRYGGVSAGWLRWRDRLCAPRQGVGGLLAFRRRAGSPASLDGIRCVSRRIVRSTPSATSMTS